MTVSVIGLDIMFCELNIRIGFDTIGELLFKLLAISWLTNPESKLKLSEYVNVTGWDYPQIGMSSNL